MRSRLLFLFAVALAARAVLVVPARAGDGSPDDECWRPPFEVSEEVLHILEQINSVHAYQTPDLPLRRDTRYANTPDELQPHRHVEPFYRHFLEQMEYHGPRRTVPEPEHVDTVKIGFLGPLEPTVSVATGGASHAEKLGQAMLRGSQLAIEQANEQGGYLRRNVPFELVIRNDSGLWGSSGEEIIDLAYRENVWAILGTIDGANSHIAIRVGLKIEIPMISSGNTDPTFIETNIPWVFRTIADDRKQSYLLIDYLYGKRDFRRVGILRASNRYGRFGVAELRDGSRRVGRPITLEMAYELGTDDWSLQLNRLRAARIDALVHWGDDEDGAGILNQMRALGMEQPFFACDRNVSDDFVRIAGENARGVICTYPWNPRRDAPKLDAFREQYRERFGKEVDTYAAHAYDSMNQLIWAVQVAGLNRAKIRDVLAHRKEPWEGVTGSIQFSAALDDIGDAYLAKFEDGQWNYYSREDLDLVRH